MNNEQELLDKCIELKEKAMEKGIPKYHMAFLLEKNDIKLCVYTGTQIYGVPVIRVLNEKEFLE